MPNRLINETSPYLLQHANNPVDWYSWGQEALSRAALEDKPILLSIGYSACHWCHVMEKESFEDADIANLMNHNFINIKVDREERPDLDAIYMEAVQTLTGSGGWPMTVFLTPDCKPFYAGTYFPPYDRQGMPGFTRILESVSTAYKTNGSEIQRVTEQLKDRMGRSGLSPQSSDLLTDHTLNQAYVNLASNFDYQNGGFGSAPKFPQPMTPEFLLRHYQRTGDNNTLNMINLTLEKMARGGMYDQIGGGLHRYSTDNYWLVPHFEKMLYDNALLSRLYLHAYQVTGRPLYQRITEEILDYVLREMRDTNGGFYSAQDADSEGEEGKFFVWTQDEISQLLGGIDGTIFGAFFDISNKGNFEGANIPNIKVTASKFAEQAGMPLDKLVSIIRDGKSKLLVKRETRIHPLCDDKILTSWNGMMLKSFAEAGAILRRQDYLDAAISNAKFLLTNMRPAGRLLRTYRNGESKLSGYLEDYAFLADALLSLYESTFNLDWLSEATELVNEMIRLFWDEDLGGFYDTGVDHEELIIRPRDLFDNAQPCGGSIAAGLLLKLALMTGNEDYETIAGESMRPLNALMTQAPGGTAQWLAALDFYLSLPKEIAIIGTKDDPRTIELLNTVFKTYLPNRVLMGSPAGRSLDHDTNQLIASLPLIKHRLYTVYQPTAFVCQNYVCQLPTVDPNDLERQLIA